jgi:putative tryptophan/tyrosine transport system substrate-binding protein
MRRREFITVLGGAAVAWPLAAWAQRAVPVIGFLGAPASAPYEHYTAAIRQGLKEAGFVEGESVAIEYRWAEGQYDRLPALAADLVNRRVAVIVTIGGAPAALAAKAATSTIPVVFHMGADPVQLGIVSSFNRPGGNVTGVTLLGVALDAKRLQLLHQLVPTARLIAFMANPTNPQSASLSREVQEAAGSIGRQILVVNASTEQEIETVFAGLVDKQVGGLLIGADTFLATRSPQIAALALRHAIPTAMQGRVLVEAGGLLSYSPDIGDVYRQAGVYAGRILSGERPSDLPVTQPTKFELVINLKTARSLGLSVPPSLLAIADEVIE